MYDYIRATQQPDGTFLVKPFGEDPMTCYGVRLRADLTGVHTEFKRTADGPWEGIEARRFDCYVKGKLAFYHDRGGEGKRAATFCDFRIPLPA